MCDICRGLVQYPAGLPTVEEAIQTVEHSRDTHIEWRDYLLKHPEALDQANGDGKLAMATPQFHEHCITRYNRVIEVLRRQSA